MSELDPRFPISVVRDEDGIVRFNEPARKANVLLQQQVEALVEIAKAGGTASLTPSPA